MIVFDQQDKSFISSKSDRKWYLQLKNNFQKLQGKLLWSPIKSRTRSHSWITELIFRHNSSMTGHGRSVVTMSWARIVGQIPNSL